VEFLQDFVENINPEVAAIVAWIFAIILASAIYRRAMGKSIRPTVPSNNRFAETSASGRSLRNLITRLGGARNCLIVAVTPTSLQVHPQFPFTLMFLPEIYGLDWDIPLSKVRAVRTEKGLFGDRELVEFVTDDGRTEQFELRLRKAPEFRTAMAK